MPTAVTTVGGGVPGGALAAVVLGGALAAVVDGATLDDDELPWPLEHAASVDTSSRATVPRARNTV